MKVFVVEKLQYIGGENTRTLMRIFKHQFDAAEYVDSKYDRENYSITCMEVYD